MDAKKVRQIEPIFGCIIYLSHIFNFEIMLLNDPQRSDRHSEVNYGCSFAFDMPRLSLRPAS